MNNTDASSLTPQARSYLDLWNDSIAEGLGRLLGVSVTVEPLTGGASDTAPQPAADSGVWIRFFAGKAGEQACFLTMPGAARLSRLLLGDASGEAGGEADALGAEGRESVVQFFQQIATMIPAADWLGFSCELGASEAERIEWEPAGDASFRFSTRQGSFLDLRSLLSADFSSALRLPKERPGAVGKTHPDQNLSSASASRSVPSTSRDVNLDLLMDVELDVTLRFGQREMLLGDILNLAPGSVVELDQQVQDPVQLLVGNKVIAWGEVVVVDGNYGLRVMGLASREERIESLRK